MRQELLDALLADDLDQVRTLLEASPELVRERVDAKRSPARQGGMTPLHLAIHNRSEALTRLLIDAGADLEATNDEGRTALHDSLEYGVTTVTELLLERGAELDLCSAAILGRLDRVIEILDADPARVNDHSTHLSPLGWAAYGNQVETARELIRRGARMDDGELLCAGSVGNVEVGRLLLEHGAVPDRVHERSGGNALHAAAAMRYTHNATNFVRMLLDAGADTEVLTSAGKTALEIAEEGARREAARPADQVEAEGTRNYQGIAELIREAIEMAK